MTATVEDLAVVGRRIEFAYHRSLIDDTATLWLPGIIAGSERGLNGSPLARIRLDGRRSTLTIPVAYEGLRYLDQVVPVPELPMGRFLPAVDEQNGFQEKAGVVLASIGEDGEELVFLTDDPAKARAAALAHARDTHLDVDYVDLDALTARWAVFEWEPEDAECLWTVRFDATEDDDKAVRIHYLPA
ncbi:hypothetical protein [Streptomyces ambofaciens]